MSRKDKEFFDQNVKARARKWENENTLRKKWGQNKPLFDI